MHCLFSSKEGQSATLIWEVAVPDGTVEGSGG